MKKVTIKCPYCGRRIKIASGLRRGVIKCYDTISKTGCMEEYGFEEKVPSFLKIPVWFNKQYITKKRKKKK